MGFLKNIFGSATNQRNNEENRHKRSGFEKYEKQEGVCCDSDKDREALDYIYDAFHKKNIDLDRSKWEGDIDQIYENLANHDVNLYRLTQALLYQNFMLMRKIDALDVNLTEVKKMCNDIGYRIVNQQNNS